MVINYRDDVAEVVLEPVPEALHVVGVDLDRGPALSTGSVSQPREMYSGLRRPDLSVYTMSGLLLISSNTHGGNGMLQTSAQPMPIRSTNINKSASVTTNLVHLIRNSLMSSGSS
jgi:hypothetical protein